MSSCFYTLSIEHWRAWFYVPFYNLLECPSQLFSTSIAHIITYSMLILYIDRQNQVLKSTNKPQTLKQPTSKLLLYYFNIVEQSMNKHRYGCERATTFWRCFKVRGTCMTSSQLCHIKLLSIYANNCFFTRI